MVWFYIFEVGLEAGGDVCSSCLLERMPSKCWEWGQGCSPSWRWVLQGDRFLMSIFIPGRRFGGTALPRVARGAAGWLEEVGKAEPRVWRALLGARLGRREGFGWRRPDSGCPLGAHGASGGRVIVGRRCSGLQDSAGPHPPPQPRQRQLGPGSRGSLAFASLGNVDVSPNVRSGCAS